MKFRLALALVLGTALAPAAFAAGTAVKFTVENQTQDTIVALYSGPSSSEEWGSNFLNGFIEPGDTIEVTLGNVTECDVDFRFEFKNSDPKEYTQVNACTMNGDEFKID